jgi:hypothetical protein
MPRVPPLSRTDHERAAVIGQHLESGHVDASDLQQIACELRRIMQAQDIGLALLEPRKEDPSRMPIWGWDTQSRLLEEVFARLRPFRSVLEALRTSVHEALSLASLDRSLAKHLRSSPAHQMFVSRTGLTEFAVIHLGRRPGEGLGRLGFFRAQGMPEFDAERRHLLGSLQPAFSRAAARIAEGRVRNSGVGIALLDSDATPIWLSDSFRFLWNAVDDYPLSVGRRALVSLLDGTEFAARVGVHAVVLKDEMNVLMPHQEFCVPCRGGRDELIASWRPVPGALFSYPDRLLQVTLEPAAPTPATGRFAGTA